MKKSVLVLLGAVALLVLWGAKINNNLVGLEESVKGQWANVESSYQRRADLIPNIVNTAKGYAEFEQETLTKVIEARSQASSVTIDPTNITPGQLEAFEQAQAGVSSSLSRLLVTFERYPELKANENFSELINELERTENRINVERNSFNGEVKTFNSKVRRFPTNIIAGMIGFEQMGYFQSAAGSDVAPVVEF